MQFVESPIAGERRDRVDGLGVGEITELDLERDVPRARALLDGADLLEALRRRAPHLLLDEGLHRGVILGRRPDLHAGHEVGVRRGLVPQHLRVVVGQFEEMDTDGLDKAFKCSLFG